MESMAMSALALKKGAALVHHYTSNGSLKTYDNRTSSLILDAALSGRSFVDLDSNSRECLITIDLVRMKEVNLNSGKEEDVVIEIPWDLKALVSNIFTSTKTVRLQILSLIVEKLRHESYVKKFLEPKAGPYQIISYRSNPFLSPKHLLYTRFLESFETAVDLNREGFGRLFDKIRYDQHIDSENQEDDMIIMCFHGTNHECMDNIMQNGMDPSLRRSTPDRDWFATSASESIKYTIRGTSRELVRSEGTKLLIFLLIKEVSSAESSGVITICSSRNQLPVGEVTFGKV